MSGSGTTVLEAYFADRKGIGFDIDPLALLLCYVKANAISPESVQKIGHRIARDATLACEKDRTELIKELQNHWNKKTKKFVNYWFACETQIELLSLLREVNRIDSNALRAFFKLIFSAIIITKTGGVSMAFDLAHTRPHRAKIVYDTNGELILGKKLAEDPSPRAKFLTKTLRSPLEEFSKRLKQNLSSLQTSRAGTYAPMLTFGDAQRLPLPENSIDLIVTSPPYAANAIDYMRAHKFSLVWLGHTVDNLSQKRGEYIGGEAITGINYVPLPDEAARVVSHIADVDEKKGQVLHRYYSEMTRVLKEMLRVLKPGKAAIVVIGSSTMRGQDTQADICLKSIGEAIGFDVPKVGIRYLDRDRRMMPTGNKVDKKSQIQQRMHEEYVIGFYKPLN
jgi:DNA modification methylase